MVWYLKSPHRLVRAFCCNFGDHQSRSGHRNAVPALRNSHRSLLLSYIFFLFCRDAKPPLRKGGWLPVGQTEGLSLSTHYNPLVSSADSPLYTRGPFPVPTIILQITLLVSVNRSRLYSPNEKPVAICKYSFYTVYFACLCIRMKGQKGPKSLFLEIVHKISLKLRQFFVGENGKKP